MDLSPARFKNDRGISLLEVLVASMLLSVVFIGTASLYTSGLKLFGGVKENTMALDSVVSLEETTKRVQLAADAYVDAPGNGGYLQLRLRGDYQLGTFTPNNTPNDASDDTWAKYRFFTEASGKGSLRWRSDTAANPATDVQATDPILISNLKAGFSNFTLVNPSSEGNSTVVTINLVANIGNPAGTQTLVSSAAVGSKSKR